MNSIILSSNGPRCEARVRTGTIYPGSLCSWSFDDRTTVDLEPPFVKSLVMVSLENSATGGQLTDGYTIGQLLYMTVLRPGDLVLLRSVLAITPLGVPVIIDGANPGLIAAHPASTSHYIIGQSMALSVASTPGFLTRISIW